MRNRKKIAALVVALVGAAAQQWVGRTDSAPRLEDQNRAQSRQALPVGDVIIGKVVKVSDGDTVTILKDRTQIKIRLLGIDAPEKSQPFGNYCRDVLAERVAGKEVNVQVGTTDRYGRTIGKISIDGRDVNRSLVESGCAWHYKQFKRNQPPADRDLYAEKELEARDRKVGLWKDPAPVPPWDYRRAKRGTRE